MAKSIKQSLGLKQDLGSAQEALSHDQKLLVSKMIREALLDHEKGVVSAIGEVVGGLSQAQLLELELRFGLVHVQEVKRLADGCVTKDALVWEREPNSAPVQRRAGDVWDEIDDRGFTTRGDRFSVNKPRGRFVYDEPARLVIW